MMTQHDTTAAEDHDDALLSSIKQQQEDSSKAHKAPGRSRSQSSMNRSSSFHHGAVRYENTYRMEPSNIFFQDKASTIIKSVFEESLPEKVYDYSIFAKLTSELSDKINERVKENLNISRYKLVSFVTVGQMRDQGIRFGSRCVWNASYDRYAAYSYKNKSLFAVGVVYAAYFE